MEIWTHTKRPWRCFSLVSGTLFYMILTHAFGCSGCHFSYFFTCVLNDLTFHVLFVFSCLKLRRKGQQSSTLYQSCQTLLEHLPTTDTDSWAKMAASSAPREHPDSSGPYQHQTCKCMNPCCQLPNLYYTRFSHLHHMWLIWMIFFCTLT